MKRWSCRILLYLFLGVVTRVSVTWGCAFWIDLARVVPAESSPEAVGTRRVKVFTRYERNAALRMGWLLPSVIITDAGSNMATGGSRDEYLASLEQKNEPEVPMGEFIDRRGWPLLAMESRFAASSGREWTTGFNMRMYENASGIALPSAQATDERGLRSLPLRPIFPGFLINTLFYAAAWCMLFLGLSTARRTIRRKRGRCLSCGYDLQGELDTGCPECGWNREKKNPHAETDHG